MADAKQQVGLNGAYYGPAVPPGRHSYRSVGRGSGCCCCGPRCLLCTLFKFILSVVVVLGIVVLVLWLVLRPNAVKLHVEEASLSRFDLTPNGTLIYKLNMTVAVRNPNQHISIYYDYVEARAMYGGSRFAFRELPPFFQGHKNTSLLYPAFDGRQLALGGLSTTFDREKAEGFYNIQVTIHTRLRFKVWFIKSNKYTPNADCLLKFPLPGTTPAVISNTKCDVDLF